MFPLGHWRESQRSGLLQRKISPGWRGRSREDPPKFMLREMGKSEVLEAVRPANFHITVNLILPLVCFLSMEGEEWSLCPISCLNQTAKSRFWGFLGGAFVKNLPANAGDTRDLALIPGSGGSLDEEMAACSCILAWKIPRTEKPGRLLWGKTG